MRVRACRDCDGISHKMAKGAVYDVNPGVATALIADGRAVLAESDAAQSVVQTAVETPELETAEARKPTRRKKPEE